MPSCKSVAVAAASLLAFGDALSSTKPHHVSATHQAVVSHKHASANHAESPASALHQKHSSHKHKSDNSHKKRKHHSKKPKDDEDEHEQAPAEVSDSAAESDITDSSAESQEHVPANSTKPQLRVELFYETLCPYCEQFMLEQLQPLWEDSEVGPMMDVALYPAGNMMTLPVDEISEGYKFFHPEINDQELQHVFQCQHGPDECFGNMVQACAMKTADSMSDSLPFIFCMASRTAQQTESMEKISFDCLSEAGLDMEPILKCVRGADGNQHMFEIGTHSDSLEPPKQWVPWVTVDGEALEMDKGETLLGGLCKRLAPEARPAACDQVKEPQEKKGILKRIFPWLNLASRSSNSSSTSLPAGFCHPDR